MPATGPICSCTERVEDVRLDDAALRHLVSRRRGTAVIETLLIFIPVWTFFFLTMQVLQYWEREHIDQSVTFESAFAERTTTGPLFDLGYKPHTESPAYKGTFMFYSEKVEESDHPGSTSGQDPNLPKYYFYVTDQEGRKVMVYRGTNTWTPFIWLRGEHFGAQEEDRVRSWFGEMGGSVIDDNRGALMLGS